LNITTAVKNGGFLKNKEERINKVSAEPTFFGGRPPVNPHRSTRRGTPATPPACGARKNLRAAAAAVLDFFDRCAFLALLHPPLAGTPQRSPVRVGEPLWRRKARQPPNPLFPPEPPRDHVTRGTLRPLRSSRRLEGARHLMGRRECQNLQRKAV
jgi:hypothetical protein